MTYVIVVGFEYSVLEKDDEVPHPVKVTHEKPAAFNGASEIPGTKEIVDESDLKDGGL